MQSEKQIDMDPVSPSTIIKEDAGGDIQSKFKGDVSPLGINGGVGDKRASDGGV